MDTDMLDRLRIESRLTESFCIGVVGDGNRVAAANGYVVDYPTFCTMLIWYMSNTMGYSKILENRPGLMPLLKNLNAWDKSLENLNGYHAINHVYNNMFKPLRGQDKKEVGLRFLSILQGS